MKSRWVWRILCISAAAIAPAYQPAARNSPATELFSRLCASCHGEAATGTDRAPALIENRKLRNRSEKQIHDLIRDGTPAGMPAFPLPEHQLQTLARWAHSLNASAYDMRPPGSAAAGEQFFFGAGRCASCHMVRGIGAVKGPDLSDAGRQVTLKDLELVLDNPAAPRVKSLSIAGCPEWAYCPQSTWDVVRIEMRDGSTLRGFARSRGKHDLQLQTMDGRLHLLRDTEYRRVISEGPLMPPLQATPEQRRDLLAYLSRLDGVKGPITAAVPPVPAADIAGIVHPAPDDWPTYNGRLNGNRHSELTQINIRNVDKLQVQWTYQLPYSPLETTPLVANGIMYVTGPNRVCTLDARVGREIWCYSRPRSDGRAVSGDAAKGANRGAAILGERVFFATDNAHLICLHRLSGALMWDVKMPETEDLIGATAAPLVVNGLVISGISGGDGPLRGFIAAYQASTGKQVWRFQTIPRPGDKAAATWEGPAMEHGGAATWTTGSYDPETGLLYWATGNPYPDTNGAVRKGDNLYTNCVLALEPETGKLRWYYQFTPHDLHDWDATEPLVLVNARYQGRDRKLLLQANRNGFFYVLDRATGEFLLGKPFVKRVNWASGIGPDGRPQLTDSNDPKAGGTKTCPAVRGATNWYSTAFHPATKLFYVMATEDCNIYTPTGMGFEALRDPVNLAEKYLRAIDIETGNTVWEARQVGAPETNYSGVLTTAGGLVFYGETGGTFAAADARSGETLWHFETSQGFKASPMTYRVNGRQHVAIAAGSAILSFALLEIR